MFREKLQSVIWHIQVLSLHIVRAISPDLYPEKTTIFPPCLATFMEDTGSPFTGTDLWHIISVCIRKWTWENLSVPMIWWKVNWSSTSPVPHSWKKDAPKWISRHITCSSNTGRIRRKPTGKHFWIRCVCGMTKLWQERKTNSVNWNVKPGLTA